MIDIDALPIPDWGLRCPRCGSPLAGQQDHRCGNCGRRFNIVSLLARHRPIPDMGLECSTCQYPLTGLTEDRCPECGNPFNLPEMLEEMRRDPDPGVMDAALVEPPDHHVAKRPPQFTGHERPLPDFGLACRSCGMELTGATGNNCPSCDEPFELDKLTGTGDLVDLTRHVPRFLAAVARSALYEAQVPYLSQRGAWQELYGILAAPRLKVPRPFVFDALHVLAELRGKPEGVAGEWVCPECHETVPGEFEICWSCQTHRSSPDSESQRMFLMSEAQVLSELESWFERQCDGKWEHRRGVLIQTLDNPGWLVEIDLKDTSVAEQPFAAVQRGCDADGWPQQDEWLHCDLKEGLFRGAGDPSKLTEILRVFLTWAKAANTS